MNKTYEITEQDRKDYPILSTFEPKLFGRMKEVAPENMEDWEKTCKWYEEVATDEDCENCGEKLPRIIHCLYGNDSMNALLDELATV
jgi:hypothetical protein